MANASTQKRIDKLKKPTQQAPASSIPKATTTVQAPITPSTKGVIPANTGNNVDTSQAMYGSGLKTPTQTTTTTPTPTQPTQTATTPAPLTPITAPQATGQASKLSSIGTTPTVPTEDYILDVNELTPEMKSVYDQMTPQAQKEFAAIGENARKTGQDYAKAQADYMAKWKAEKEYQDEQQKIKMEVQGLSEGVAKRQSTQRLDAAATQLSNLKQNLAYLGTLGRPGVSGVQLDAVQKQITQAQDTFKKLEATEMDAQRMRELGYEFDANAYERQMVQLEDELDRNVKQTIQDAINSFGVEVENIDTDEEFEALRVKILDQIDTKVAEYGAGTVEQMNFLSTQAQQIQTDAMEKAKLQGTVNKELSKAQGVLIDGLGKPVLSASTGMPIAYQAEAPLEPIRDKESGQLVSFAYGPNGEIVTTVDQVIEQPTFSQETFANLANAVKNGYMTADQAMDIVPQASRGAFIQQLGSMGPKPSSTANKQITTIENPDGTKQSVIFDPETGSYTPVSTNYQTPNGVPVQDAIAIAISKCATGAQCGKFVNDVLEAAGMPRLVKNEYESKVQAIQAIGEAYSMEDVGAGSIFAYPVSGSEYGHIGIVTSVNDDGTINIMDYNYNNDEQQRERLNVNPGEILNKGGLLSNPIIREDTVPESQQQEEVKKPLTKEEKSTLFSIQDDLKADPRRKEYLTLQSKIKTLDGIKSRLDNNTATAQDKQQLISDSAKVLDPTSVVREGEYALAAKYGQSKVNKTIQDISNWYSTNGPISDDSAKVLAEAVGLRFEATQLANDEAVAEQKGRAEIFLGRPVSYEELAVTQNAPAPTSTQGGTTTITPQDVSAGDDLFDRL